MANGEAWVLSDGTTMKPTIIGAGNWKLKYGYCGHEWDDTSIVYTGIIMVE